MPEIIIIRGVSGTGKTTLAKKMQAERRGCEHYEADMYFEKNGEYKFDARELPTAHLWCKNAVRFAMKSKSNVIVSNTFCQHWEYRPYLKMAKQYGYSVKIIVLKKIYGNIHGVIEDAVLRQMLRWQD